MGSGRTQGDKAGYRALCVTEKNKKAVFAEEDGEVDEMNWGGIRKHNICIVQYFVCVHLGMYEHVSSHKLIEARCWCLKSYSITFYLIFL